MNEAWRVYAVAALAADDENGHRVPRLDSEGRPIKDEDGEVIKVWQEYTVEERMPVSYTHLTLPTIYSV